MHKQTIKTFGRITILTLIIVVFLRVSTAFLDTSDSTVENKYNFKSASSSQLGNVGVAVSTNVGIRFQEKQRQLGGNNSGISLGELSGDALTDRQEILSVNILALKDYNNLIKTDVRQLLADSGDRKKALDGFISLLEARYTNGVKNGRSLEVQQAKLEADMETALAAVAIHKAEMSAGLKAHDTTAITVAMDNYLIETNNYNIAQSNLMFVKYFVRKYLEFSVYNKGLLDTLINNKEALSTGSFVVIPDSGADLLKDLNLIYDESEFKSGESNSSSSTISSPNTSQLNIPSGSLFETGTIKALEVGKFYTRDLILNQNN